MLTLSRESEVVAGILLIAIVTIEFGGTYMLRIVRGKEDVTEFQHALARAGHAHAGVLVILGLVAQVFVDAAGLAGAGAWLGRSAIPISAILVSAGFFFASMGKGRTAPNGFIVLLYAGAVSLAAGSLALGIGLLAT